MKKFLATTLVLFSLMNCTSAPKQEITVGSKNFTEQVILAELIKQYVEGNSAITVNLKDNLGGTFVCHKALVAGDIDAYVEYTGTAFTAILKNNVISNRDDVFKQVQKHYSENFKVDWLNPLGFENTYAMIIRQTDAKKHGVKTLSDFAKVSKEMRAGFYHEFTARKDGFPGLSKKYKIAFKETPKTMEYGLMYRAIESNEVDFIAGSSTDGLIAKLGLTILKDDKNYFPPYDAAVLLRQETSQKHPELKSLLEKLSGQLKVSDMQKLNAAVDAEKQDVKVVVKNFLKEKNLI